MISKTRINLYYRLWKTFKANPGYYFYLLRRNQSSRIRKVMRQGRMPSSGSYFPTKLNLRILYDCNLRCKMCGQWGKTGAYFAYDKTKRGTSLQMDVIDRVLDELAPMGLKLVDMEGGETLLYPEFEQLLERVRRRGIYLKFVTNGTLLDKHAEAIVRSGVASVTVSLDGDKETHNSIRGRNWAYDKTINGLYSLAETKARLRRDTPLVQIAFTVSRNNGAKVLKQLCQDLKGKNLIDVFEIKLTPIFIPKQAEQDYITLVKSCLDVDEGILCPGGFSDDYADFIDEGYRLMSVVSELKKETLDFFIEPLPHIPFQQIPRLYEDYWWDLGRGPCPVPFDEPTIDADGNVYPCNLFTDLPISVGNVYKTSFLEIWHGAKFMKFRKVLMEQGGLLPICNRCCQLTEH